MCFRGFLQYTNLIEVNIKMAKEFKVFFSWQSDLSANQTKLFIEESIEMAKKLLPDSIVLIPDEATRNRLGSPDIMNSIFEKIDDCDLFIADVSIVGQYSLPAEEGEDPIIKHLPNPNVLLELGYAAARISWDRCICFANTKFGSVSQLPFDLNHRRITDISYENSTRKQKISDIAEIIKSTVLAYIDKPIAKIGFAHHMIGCFDFNSGGIVGEIIPYNNVTMDAYCRKTQTLLEKAKATVIEISEIKLPAKTIVVEEDFEEKNGDMTIGDILKDPELSRQISLITSNAHDVKIDKEYINANTKNYFGIDIEDSFYNVGNLQECSSIIPHTPPSLEGSDLEKKKFKLIEQLEDMFAKIELREVFRKLFDDILIIPLSIKNASTKNDERISINIKVNQGMPIRPTSKFFDPDYAGLEGLVYDEHLIKELLKLPESSLIKYDSSFSREAISPVVPRLRMPAVDAFGYMSSPSSDSEDYEQELQDYIQDIDEDSGNEFSFSIGALRPNETIWLDKVLLIKPVDGIITIDYSLKSNNTTGYISGSLCYSQENL